MDAVYRQLNEALARGERVALAVLVEAKGSTPQKAGAKALFFPDGRIIGTLGGGCLEAETRTKALRALDTGELQTFHAVLDDDFGWDDGLICGGSVRIFIQPNPAQIPAIPERQRAVLITDLRTGHRELRADNQPVMCVEDEKFYEPVLPKPTLIICGAGHLGEAVAKLGAWSGFTVTVLDDRPDYANRQRFPDAHEIIVADPATAIRSLPVDAATYITLVTRGHRHDAQVLREVIHSNAAYIGMIGSKRKLRTVVEGFIKEGVATAEDFHRVHSPMGVPIGSTNVEEIAVSIVAELVAVRRGVKAPSLSATGLLLDSAKDSLASRR
ncbi:MAG: putative xanthine dehydrogenase subunit A [Verrucomicrobiae bacterium]|nr:putative xanthine dehydrogenase subunit A [Verrucomicrobiae bacterium]